MRKFHLLLLFLCTTVYGFAQPGTENQLFAFGNGQDGRLGTGNTNNQNSPVQIGTTNWQQVSAGAVHSLAVKSDGTLWAWGDGAGGRLGTGNNNNQSSPISIGTD